MDLRIQIPFETPKLRRLIRPLRAKLTTLNKTTSAHPSVLSHSSYSYSSAGSSKISNTASFGTAVGFGGLGVGAFGGYSKKPKITYKKRKGSFNHNDREYQSFSNDMLESQSASVSSSSTNRILNSQTSSESSGNPTSSQSPIRPTSVKTAPIPLPSTILSTPLRTHALSIRECYRELIQRLWFDGLLINSFSNYELYQNPSLEPAKFVRKRRVPSLIELSAMEVGKLIARTEKEEKDHDDDSGRGMVGRGELDVIEQIYEDIFSQWRRFVMLGHVTELCVQEIAIDSILLSLIEICIEHQAVCQGQSLLLHLISLNPSPLLLHQAYNLSIHAVQSHLFLDRVTEHLTCQQVTSTKDRYFFYQFLSVLNSHRAVVIGSKALALLLEELIKVEEEHAKENETQGKGKLDEIEYPIRTEQHLAGLIEIIVTRSLDIDSVLPTSTSVSGKNIENSDQVDGIILRTIELLIKSKYLFHQYADLVYPLLLRGVQIFYLHSKTSASHPYSNRHPTNQLSNLTLPELTSLIAKFDPTTSVSLLFTTFATSKNIFNLSKLLAEVGLIYHAVSITDELLSEHETFEPLRGSSRARSFFAEDDDDDNDYESTNRTRRNRGRKRLGSARNKTDEKGTERIRMRNGVTTRMLEEFRDYCEAEIELYEDAGADGDSDAAKGYWYVFSISRHSVLNMVL
ncbi:hypothetical protein BKA69DRAFT_185584 [Paraphysoderma sedebokerense]|nr:hypothetical protein BKA69DRAFT_185584 [Paraphysoderma sedebokerense]